ncbi:flagellar motor switch protein FliG [Enterovirga rhinocerotis]|uniref:Flagellar motor switch protein FliG n=1 Tax=Enterovirga rhinocerotis TaxID=1339210 RepID=A0A4R7C101_9HYPH|nr:flagellar motor switch protein FliG [Enterovirga rhinocerotis]TDR90056.1 flagellar motor switch protein FliG [Enterovirga rhinocerotis]
MTTTDHLDGARRAATVMLVLGEELSAPLWSYLDGDEVKKLSMAMMDLGEVGMSSVSDIAAQFCSEIGGADRFVGNVERTEAFLRSVLPKDKAEAVISDIRDRADHGVWKRLAATDLSALSAYLNGEHPQTVALILSKLPPSVASKIISAKPNEVATDIIRRLIGLNSVPREAFEDLERTLEEEVLSAGGRTSQRDAYAAVAEIVNSLEKQAEERVLSELDRTDPDAATRIRELMFTFDDVGALPDPVIQTIIRGIDKYGLTKALRGAPDALKARFLKNMSSRAAATLTQDIEALGPIRTRDVEEARAEIVSKVKEMEAAGEIVIGSDEPLI